MSQSLGGMEGGWWIGGFSRPFRAGRIVTRSPRGFTSTPTVGVEPAGGRQGRSGDQRSQAYRPAVTRGLGVVKVREDERAKVFGSYMASILAGGATAWPAVVTRA